MWNVNKTEKEFFFFFFVGMREKFIEKYYYFYYLLFFLPITNHIFGMSIQQSIKIRDISNSNLLILWMTFIVVITMLKLFLRIPSFT